MSDLKQLEELGGTLQFLVQACSHLRRLGAKTAEKPLHWQQTDVLFTCSMYGSLVDVCLAMWSSGGGVCPSELESTQAVQGVGLRLKKHGLIERSAGFLFLRQISERAEIVGDDVELTFTPESLSSGFPDRPLPGVVRMEVIETEGEEK